MGAEVELLTFITGKGKGDVACGQDKWLRCVSECT